MSETPLIQREVPETLRARYVWIRKLCHWLDEGFEIPIVKYRIGLDPIFGLVFGFGDVVSLACSIYVLYLMRGFGVPKRDYAIMVLTVLLDFAMGLIFGWGQAADFFYKANIRNWRRFSSHFYLPEEV